MQIAGFCYQNRELFANKAKAPPMDQLHGWGWKTGKNQAFPICTVRSFVGCSVWPACLSLHQKF